ncbi:hypothetical protein PsorP6_001951 [Peronosclerospora sorghi]|uniref:Uncharacterized protein n=1 Tax=Peronosclerospora sorghi TaxID=230839 RepID=A0ACC0WUV7_9STRA|nr:hypothetical protein PsorP6_001951 [Peronosclerospora sorghi]
MPLLHAIGSTGLDTTFTVAFVFLSGESDADFLWALQHIASKVNGGIEMFPRVIVTDADGQLRSAIEEAFPGRVCHLYCIWHINNNVLAKEAKTFVHECDLSQEDV